MVAEHKNQRLSPSTLNTVTAAAALGTGELTMLVAGGATDTVTEAAKSVVGVSKVLTAQHHALEHYLAEPWSALLTSLQAKLASRNPVCIAEILCCFPCKHVKFAELCLCTTKLRWQLHYIICTLPNPLCVQAAVYTHLDAIKHIWQKHTPPCCSFVGLSACQ